MSLNLSVKSANSDSKSKRSFNSISSNPSSSNNNSNNSNNNKKKKTSQKTLGVAWGSNSRSSSRSSFRSAPFSDFGSYMVVKNQKLHEQFDAEASSSSHSGSGRGKPIFQGVSIFVDGYTIPSSQELRRYMLTYGGRFENYFSRRRVTHIICSNLPDSKIKNLRSFSGGLPVVKPTWIVDSVAANKLLSWVPYQLDQLASEAQNQPKLSSFFTVKSSPVTDDAATCVSSPGVSETENTLTKDGRNVDANFPVEFGATECIQQFTLESDNPVLANSSGAIHEEPSCSRGTHNEAEVTGGNYITTEGGCSDGFRPQSITCQDSASAQSDCQDNPNMESSSSKAIRTSSQRHSTLTDTNFVENYFKSSRLHFIGTWRTRYRKRFPNLSNGFKFNSSIFATSQKSTIIHVDMDCFFVSVVIRNHPELRDKAVAVCHSDNPRGTAEISSANYPARDYGVKAGMFVRDAKARCPHLVIFPYNFEAYEEVADQFYNILHKHCNKVQAVSCDEAFLDVTDSLVEDPQLLASIIRKEILDTTGCTASAGIAGNMLMARLATRIAKPDGQSYIAPEKVEDFLLELPVKALPGIGHVLEGKLKRRQIRTCGQLRTISKESLQKDFGLKTGEMLWNYSRGIDNRLVGVIQETKSIGAEVNWGVRFNDLNDAQQFLVKLSKEVALRLQGCGVQGRTFILKIKKRKSDAGEPMKYLGCGDCENLSHSITVPMATDNADVLQRISTQLFGSFHIDVNDIRGMGLQVSKLEDADGAKQGSEKGSIRSWLLSASSRTRDQHEIGRSSIAPTGVVNQIADGDLDQLCTDSSGPHGRRDVGSYIEEANINRDATLPPLHDLDMGVLESLPPDVLAEINNMYGGELISFISKSKSRGVHISDKTTTVSQSVGGGMSEDLRPLSNFLEPSNKLSVCNEIKGSSDRDILVENSLKSSVEEKREEENRRTNVGIQVVPVSGGRSSNSGIPDALSGNISLMPSSLSQIDTSVLQQLPEDLRTDILELLPAHRVPESAPDVSLDVENQTEPRGSSSSDDLWVGSPPRWIDKFKASSCVILNMFSELYFRAGSSGQLSSILQQAVSDTCIYLDVATDARDVAASCLCELFKQYVNLKIETDIEEIYICSCLLRRLSTRSKFFVQIYDIFLPHLQASVGEIYGGNLYISSVKD